MQRIDTQYRYFCFSLFAYRFSLRFCNIQIAKSTVSPQNCTLFGRILSPKQIWFSGKSGSMLWANNTIVSPEAPCCLTSKGMPKAHFRPVFQVCKNSRLSPKTPLRRQNDNWTPYKIRIFMNDFSVFVFPFKHFFVTLQSELIIKTINR